MIRSSAEAIVRLRNPQFRFDANLDSRLLLAFLGNQLWDMVRGWQVLFAFRNPKGMLRGTGVSFRYLHRIQWGKFLKLGKGVTISGLGKNGVHLGDHVGIGDYSRIIASTSLNHIGEGITIGNRVGIGEFAYLGGGGGLWIGDDVIAGQYLSCHPENHIYSDPHQPIRLQGVSRKGIRIGANCWLGSKVTILDGVELGEGCVVAAGAVVTRSFPAFSVIGGVPAKILSSNIPS